MFAKLKKKMSANNLLRLLHQTKKYDMTLDTNCVKESDSLLLVWGKDTNPQQLQADISPIKDKCSHVHLENAERLLMAGLAQSSFDVVACGYLGDMSVTLSADCFAEVAKVLKPGGRLMLREACVKETSNGLRTCAQLSSALKLAGFIDVSKPVSVDITDKQKSELKGSLGACDLEVVDFCALKPNYEVGAAAQLSFAPADKSEVAKVWSLNDLGDDDVDLIDDDDLLDEDDLVKPDPSSLRVNCDDGPKKRKACKDCSCGLAEELDAEAARKEAPPPKATSSCGNCYLGDAFRCASCPYLGMPAFKPGEKIVLSDRQLNVDQ
ncbi:hypothetical protein CAPTEDRAFT_150525 [Capitella teleta]|uniref:Anamorsin homolog n=1 Tax=Capitella teleta TaxID=283909 RepID=R7T7N8_CAPTE|nr:hypothetical protein CAPTEDRAFT_150525 [Capitella teleta]|eukprot:ELT87435.1 hypothetical protein CAPTEDRAFT_150525 [Capitella teleta]